MRLVTRPEKKVGSELLIFFNFLGRFLGLNLTAIQKFLVFLFFQPQTGLGFQLF